MTSSQEADDLLAFWHLEYEGNMELDEFMCSQARWTQMEFEYWAVTGKMPGEGCEGPDKDDEVFDG